MRLLFMYLRRYRVWTALRPNEFSTHLKGLRWQAQLLPQRNRPEVTSCGKRFSTVLFFDEDAVRIE